jgi:hypothetical protein
MEKSSQKGNYLYNNSKIAIIIPAYNEAKNIGSVLKNIPTNISDKLDIIVIDDGSTDQTANIASNHNTHIIVHEKNLGNGAATRSGLEYCKNRNYDVVVILDADGQHDPKYLPQFIEPIIHDEYHFTIGNRFKHYYKMSAKKRFCSLLITGLYKVILRKHISDPTNGYRALSSDVVKNLELESNYSVTQEMLLKVIPFYEYKEIPIQLKQRKSGSSFISLKKYLPKMLLFVLKYYIFPKIRKFSNFLFHEKTRSIIGYYLLKT